MPKNSENREELPYKSARRAARKRPPNKASRPQRRGRERRLSVRSELRESPDVRKIARAVVAMALAQAEAEAQAAAAEQAADQPRQGGAS